MPCTPVANAVRCYEPCHTRRRPIAVVRHSFAAYYGMGLVSRESRPIRCKAISCYDYARQFHVTMHVDCALKLWGALAKSHTGHTFYGSQSLKSGFQHCMIVLYNTRYVVPLCTCASYRHHGTSMSHEQFRCMARCAAWRGGGGLHPASTVRAWGIPRTLWFLRHAAAQCSATSKQEMLSLLPCWNAWLVTASAASCRLPPTTRALRTMSTAS